MSFITRQFGLLLLLHTLGFVSLLEHNAQAATRRVALLVSHDQGGEALPSLRYTARDAQRLGEVLGQFGGFSPDRIYRLQGQNADRVWRMLDAIDVVIKSWNDSGDEVVFLFYYSGHSKNGHLCLGDSRLDMKKLKARLKRSPARVRIALIDSCGAGAMVRSKGAIKGANKGANKGASLAAPFVIALDDSLSAAGQVLIASSSADEASQESDDLQGSFFTHFFAAALRGDADSNQDGQVALSEAYAYAYTHTVTATSTTRAGTQHPSYLYDLHGAGDVVLSTFAEQGSVLTFPEDLGGLYYVVDEDQQRIVAEINKKPGETRRLAVKGGHYVIKKRLPDHLLMQRIQIPERSSLRVDEGQMQRVAFRDDYAKGAPILQHQYAQNAIRLSLSLGAGVQSVFAPPGGDNQLFPNIGLLAFEARIHDLLRKNLIVSMDLAFGGRDEVLLLDAGSGLGTLRYPLRYTELQAGVGLYYQWRPGLLGMTSGTFQIATGPRLAALFMNRVFASDAPIESQYLLSMSPGWTLLMAWQFWRHAHVEILGRLHYLPYFVDENRSFGYAEGLASLWWDF